MYPYQLNSLEEYQRAYQKSIDQPEEFWAEIAENFQWKKKWDKVLDWNFVDPSIQWFKGGTLNITENCLDRHLADKGDQAALIWEANDPNESSITYTYKELHAKVMQFAHVLQNNGVKKATVSVFTWE